MKPKFEVGGAVFTAEKIYGSSIHRLVFEKDEKVTIKSVIPTATRTMYHVFGREGLIWRVGEGQLTQFVAPSTDTVRGAAEEPEGGQSPTGVEERMEWLAERTTRVSLTYSHDESVDPALAWRVTVGAMDLHGATATEVLDKMIAHERKVRLEP